MWLKLEVGRIVRKLIVRISLSRLFKIERKDGSGILIWRKGLSKIRGNKEIFMSGEWRGI